MKKRILGSLAGLLMITSAAHAQCSAWDNTLDIAEVLGDPNVIIETLLSNDAVL